MRAKSFFTEIQGKFRQSLEKKGDSLSDFQGRYLANVIQLVGSRHPQVYAALKPKTGFGRLWAALEYPYSNTVNRKADLALFRGDDLTPTTLVEIKANDGGNWKFNDSQIADYADWARIAAGRNVVILTQFPLPISTREKIRECEGLVNELSVSSLVRELRRVNRQGPGSELIDMLVDYLQEKGLVMTRLTADDIFPLKTFLTFSFLPHISFGGKVTSAERVASGPRVLSTLIQNWQLLSAHVNDAQRACLGKELAKQTRPVVKFRAAPMFKEGARLTTDDDAISKATYDKKLGGSWLIYADTVPGTVEGRQIHLRYGMTLEISKGTPKKKEEAFDAYVWALLWLRSRDLGEACSDTLRPSGRSKGNAALEQYAHNLSDEAALLKQLRSVIRKACAAAIRTAKQEGDEKLEAALRQMREPLVAFH